MSINSFTSSNNPFYLACLNNDKATLDSLLDKPYTKDDLAGGLESACQGGHRALVDLMIEKIEKEANNWSAFGLWNACLDCACLGGYRDIVDLMIEKGANNWNDGLWSACIGGNARFTGGHGDVIDLMIEKGATQLLSAVAYLSCDDRFIAHIILHLKKQRRDEFIDDLQKENDEFTTIVYLTNHHLIRCASQPLQTKKRTLSNILQQFVCTDVATWSSRFVGWCVFD